MGESTRFGKPVAEIVGERLWYTGKLMFWVMIVMVPSALLLGVLAGMREGTFTDRSLSTLAITTTATPEYVSGVIFSVIFASSIVGLRWMKASATSATDGI
ncbi:MAG: ABC transporter permease, partial [Pseudomonadota bacterium]